MSFRTRTLAGLNVRSIGPTPAPLTILFLHYWGGTARTWDSSIRSLLKTHPNVNAVAYDSRGYGASTKPEGDRAAYSISRLADDALQVVGGLEPQPKRVVIVGHSMGGKVAQLAAARWAAHAKATAGFPALAGLFLASPGPSPASIVPEEFAQQLLHSYDSAETVQLTVQHALSANGWESFSEEVRKQITEDALSGSAFANEVWVRDGLPEDNEKEVVAGLSGAGKVPTVVITGDQDKVHPIPLLESAVVGKIEGAAELVVLPGVGHLLPLEAEDQFVEQLSKFISKL